MKHTSIKGVSKYSKRHRTPYHLVITEAAGWRIGFGPSSFLVAKGSGFSRPIGYKLLRTLELDWLKSRNQRAGQ